MPESVARRQTYTAKKSIVSLPETTAGILEVLRKTLQDRRGVRHTKSDAMMIAVETVLAILPSEAIIVARNMRYENILGIETTKVRYPKVCDMDVRELAKKSQVSRKALIHACISIFSKALVVSDLRRYGLKAVPQSVLQEERIRLARSKSVPLVPKAKAKMRKANRKKDQANMGYRSYLAEFQAYMEQFGGLEDFVDKELQVPIYTLPILGMIGTRSDLELPLESNVGRIFTARIWKRGRGLNLTIHSQGPAVDDVDEVDLQGPDGDIRTITPPELPVGSVWRLYDIYRNIDWSSVTKQTQ